MRVNSNKLHHALISEISEIAQHPWRARRRIEEAVRTMPDANRYDKQIAAVERRLKESERAIEKLTDATTQAPTSALPALLRHLGDEEEKRAALASEKHALETEQSAARWRPTIQEAHRAMNQFSTLWENAEQEERVELASLMVERAEMQDRHTCRVVLLPDFVVHERESSTTSINKGG